MDLQVPVTAPQAGTDLPVILLPHSNGASNNPSSPNGYAPIANLWAAAGFVVIQSTHLSSRTLSQQLADKPGAPFSSRCKWVTFVQPAANRRSR